MNLADIAANLGLPVFPCLSKPGTSEDKNPIVPRGFHAASNDPATIGRMFANPAAGLIGVPTGAASGFIIVDVDTKPGKSGARWLEANSHRLPQTRTHRTQSGGLHLVFLMPLDVEIRNSQSRLGEHVDVRGEGGYAIWPPSPGYAVADATPAAEMPDWLVRACLKPEAAAQPQQPYTGPSQPPSDRYAAAAFDGECKAVAEAREGTRNAQLNISAVKLGSLVAAGSLDRSTVESALTAAALSAGLDPVEIRKTIASGLGFGMQNPRQLPERSAPLRMAQEIRVAESRRGDDPHAAAGVGQQSDRAPGPIFDPETGEVLGYKPAPKVKSSDLVWFADIKPVLDAKDFVQGVLVESSSAVVYGESNAGKTFWANDLALHVAAGMPWNGRRVDQGGVIYCVLEGSGGFANRVCAWRDAVQPAGPVYFAARQSGLNLLDPNADMPRLLETIADAAASIPVPVKLIVIDTLARAFAGGNENASEDMGALVLNMTAIQRATGACVLFIHHSGKDAAKGARGHSSLRAALETEIEVVANEETGLRTATTVKQRELKKGDTFNFTLPKVVLGQNQYGEDVTTCVVAPASSEMVAAAEAEASNGLTGHQATAHRILMDLLAEPGRAMTGAPGTPPNAQSVPAAWWKERFEKRAMPGATPDTKSRTFRRVAGELVTKEAVCMDNNRVWLP
jgi:hypothetical protein